jgi:hypothetical protein
MQYLSSHSLARNSNQLSLFDWQPNDRQQVFGLLSITRKLANQTSISPSVLNAMAEANGYIGREASNV